MSGATAFRVVHVFDGLIRHVGGQVVTGMPDPGKNLGMILEKIGRPLVGLAAHEPVEIFEAHPRRPLVVGPGDAVLKVGVLCSLPNHDVA